MNSDLEEIKSRLNIVDVLGEYIRLERAGANFRALCPFHNEKSPSFMVSEDKQFWHCFGCQKGGDIFTFVMEIEGLEFREALKLMAEKAGVTLAAVDPKQQEKKNKTLGILELATKFYEIQLWNGAGKTKIMDYLRKRGLSEESIRRYRLGYAPKGWRNLLQFLTGRGYKIEDMVRTGLLVEKNNVGDGKATSHKPQTANHYDRFRERIMFPIADPSGKVVGFTARVEPGGDESQAKYVNTPETEVYHKSRILYGIDKARQEIKKREYALLVEGNMDVIAAAQAGIENVVAVSGTALTEEQLSILKRYAGKVKMFFDMDSAGEAATRKSLKLCFKSGISAEVVELPFGKDAADVAREDPAKLVEAVGASKPAMEYFFLKVLSRHDKGKAEGQKRIVGELLDMVVDMESEIEKAHWIKRISQELGLKEEILTDMLKKATLEDRLNQAKKLDRPQTEDLPTRRRIDILAEDLSGMMLVYADVWKDVCQKERGILSSLGDKTMGTLLEQGEMLGFSFDNLMGSIADPDRRLALEKLLFDKKFRLDLNNNLEEIILDDPRKEAEKIIREIKKEIVQDRLRKISEDLRIAKEKGDEEAVRLLLEESRDIHQELFSL